jgi:WD40 repeat protein
MDAKATSVCSKSAGGASILVGTRGGEIIEFDAQTGKPTVYMRSHFDGELWGLAVHPNKAEVYTFGRDGLLGVWDLTTRRQLKYAKLDTPGDVVAFSNQG